MLKKVTFGVLNLKIKMTKRSLTVLLLSKLQRRRLGTNDVENFCMNIKRKYAKNKMRSSMMTNKIKDAKYQEQKIRKLFISRRDYLVRRWGFNNQYFMTRFNILMQEEVEFVWNTGKTRLKAKIDFLANKRQNILTETPEVAEIQGILNSDEKLTEKFGPVIPEAPVVYGGVQLDENESLAMSLDPKYAVFPRYDIEDVQVGLQTLAVKVRMECRNREQRDEEDWSEAWQLEQSREKTVFDEETSTLHCPSGGRG